MRTEQRTSQNSEQMQFLPFPSHAVSYTHLDVYKRQITDDALNTIVDLYSGTSGIRDLAQAAENIAAHAL